MPAAAPGLPARRFEAVLLDMDGTLVDSIASVERSWLRWCGEYGVDPQRLAGLHGVTARNVIADLLPEEQREEAFRRIERIEVDDVDGITVLPGADPLLRALAAAGVPTAVVTSASTPLAEARLAATGLPHPPVVVTSDDVARGKPWPDPWLLGAQRLGVAPGDCLVVEDAVAGLRAARAAGCGALVAVATTMAVAELAPEADLVVRDLADLRLDVDADGVRVLGAHGATPSA